MVAFQCHSPGGLGCRWSGESADHAKTTWHARSSMHQTTQQGRPRLLYISRIVVAWPPSMLRGFVFKRTMVEGLLAQQQPAVSVSSVTVPQCHVVPWHLGEHSTILSIPDINKIRACWETHSDPSFWFLDHCRCILQSIFNIYILGSYHSVWMQMIIFSGCQGGTPTRARDDMAATPGSSSRGVHYY